MPNLCTQRDFRDVQTLGFCYLCAQALEPDQEKDRDHVPPRRLFLPDDRSPTLWLPTHKSCNGELSLGDEKIAHLIGLKYGRLPKDPRNRPLRFALRGDLGAVINCDVDAAVWRWIRGFHAALYREPLPLPIAGALVTPFPRGEVKDRGIEVEGIRPQHLNFVSTIKLNRAFGNLDRIRSNGHKLTYECVWSRADNDGPWLCIFALDLYDWKDLGATKTFPARGCAGFYHLGSGGLPKGATAAKGTRLLVPNRDPLDPFGT